MKTVQKHLLRRYLLLCMGLVIMAFGVAFSIKGGLGTSPIFQPALCAQSVYPAHRGALTPSLCTSR